MNGRRSARAALTIGTILLSGCTLDFGRYDPDQNAEADAPSYDSSWDAAADQTQVPPPDAYDGADIDASTGLDGTSSCTMPSDCFPQATSCGMACGRSYQTCMNSCGGQGCMQRCTSTEQSCLGSCVSVCIACAKDAGCNMSNGCVASAHP